MDDRATREFAPFPQKHVMPLLLRVFGTKPPAKAIEQGLCADLLPETASEVVARFTPDRGFPPAVQGEMIGNVEATKVVELDSGHLPMMSRPGEVARILAEST